MGKIIWKSSTEIEKEKAKDEEKRKEKTKFKCKDFSALSRKEKDDLLMQIAEQLGYL